MATTTTNLGLTKPAGTDKPDIKVINENMDKIDAAVAGIEIGGRNLFLGTKDFSVGVSNVTGIFDLTNKIGAFTVLKAKCPSDRSYYDPFSQKFEFEPNTQYTLSFYVKADSTCIVSSFFYNIGNEGTYKDGFTQTAIGTKWKKYVITWTTGDTARLASVIPIRLQDTKDVWVYMYAVKFEKGNKATDWTPAPEDVDNEIDNEIDNSIIELSMLGWSVPKECPIQNEVNGNQFTQKVGRVDLGSLAFQYDTTEGHERMRTVSVLQGAKGALVNNIGNIYTSIYTRSSANYTYLHRTDKTISIDDYCVIWIYDTSYTDASTFKQAMQGQYLYYELAAPITTTIDGNEIGEIVSDVRKETTVNLLKPALETTTQNGVTCTNNEDGTYTLNGTANEQVIFVKDLLVGFEPNKKYKIVGCPKSGGEDKYYIQQNYKMEDGSEAGVMDFGEGAYFIPKRGYACSTYFVIRKGATLNNDIFKPMVTTNLNATYDDFVPYTGDTGSLNWDVAEIQENMATIELGTDITD